MSAPWPRPTTLLLPLVLVPLASAGIWDPDAILEPAPLELLVPGAPMTDPVFDTTLHRVSDTSEQGTFATHIYSQLQAFSPDNGHVLLIEDATYIVRRMSDLSRIEGLDTSGWNAPRWDPAAPGAILHYDSNADTTIRVQRTDVETQEVETLYTFPAGYERINGGRSFDEVSRDGRWMAGFAQRDDGAGVIFSLDLDEARLGAVHAIPDLYDRPCEPDPEWGEVWPDWIGVSPLGFWLVVQWERDGTTRCSGLETFHIETGAFEGRVYDGHQHGDLGVDTDGITEYLMVFELANDKDPNRPGTAIRLLPGEDTVSPPIHLQVLDWADDGHISCQGPAGVCLVSYGSRDDDEWTPFEDELFLQYTNGSVERVAHHRSSSCGYWVQPRGTWSTDGAWAVFASDWDMDADETSCDEWNNDLGVGDPILLDLGFQGIPIPDSDGDGLNDLAEEHLGTDPLDPDTDRDALWDGPEYFTHRTDPVDPDTDGDLFGDATEVDGGSDPNDWTSVPTPLGPVDVPLVGPGAQDLTDPLDPVA